MLGRFAALRRSPVLARRVAMASVGAFAGFSGSLAFAHPNPPAKDDHKAPAAKDDHKAPVAKDDHKAPVAKDDHKAPAAKDDHKAPAAKDDHKAPAAKAAAPAPAAAPAAPAAKPAAPAAAAPAPAAKPAAKPAAPAAGAKPAAPAARAAPPAAAAATPPPPAPVVPTWRNRIMMFRSTNPEALLAWSEIFKKVLAKSTAAENWELEWRAKRLLMANRTLRKSLADKAKEKDAEADVSVWGDDLEEEEENMFVEPEIEKGGVQDMLKQSKCWPLASKFEKNLWRRRSYSFRKDPARKKEWEEFDKCAKEIGFSSGRQFARAFGPNEPYVPKRYWNAPDE